tara:strand:- start:898 stop:3660 length:2763 start_codon:yes stop_codon:yes gene_type:complete
MSIENLTPQQIKAVQYVEGPCKIVAGPGSGKTKTIVSKYLNLFLEKKMNLSNILLLTFSNKATNELRERVIKHLDSNEQKYEEENLKIFTIHSFCKKELEDNFTELKEKIYAANILDEISQGSFILRFNRIFALAGRLESCKKVFDEILGFFNKMSNENLDFEKVYSHLVNILKNLYKKHDDEPDNKDIHEKSIRECSKLLHNLFLHREYLSKLKEEKVIDFANLQSFFLKELKNNQKLLIKIREKYKYILVDEYQDTSYVQSQIIYELAKPSFNLTVCGDEDQSIYRFRGATVKNFISFEKNLDNSRTKTFFLNYNFRSVSKIVDSSNKIVENIPFRNIEKKIVSKNEEDGDVFYTVFKDPNEEAKSIVKIVKYLKENKNINYGEQAVLFRSVINESKNLVNCLKSENIPFRVYGANKLDTSRILNDLINIWIFCTNNSDETIELNESNLFYKNKTKATELFKKIKKDLVDDRNKKSKERKFKSNLSFFYTLLHTTDFFKTLIESNNNLQLEDLSYLSKKIYEIDLSLKKTDPVLVEAILNNSKIRGDVVDERADDEKVSIMTIHQSKGLEFTACFLPFLVKKRNPSIKDAMLYPLYHYEINDPVKVNDTDEQRLRYVSFTRAKNFNFLSRPEKIQTKRGNLRKWRHEPILDSLNLGHQSAEEIINQIKSHSINTKPKIKEHNLRERMSYSRLSVYITCPRKYNFQYNLGFATVRSEFLNIGTSSHLCLNHIHKNYLNKKKIKYNKEELEQIVEDNWVELPARRAESRRLKKNLLINLKNYLKKYIDIFPNIYKSEHKFAFHKKDKNYELTGAVDLILKDNKNMTIIDFKQKDIDNIEYKNQMALYYYVADKAFNQIQKFKLWLISVAECKHKEIMITKNDLEKFEKKVDGSVKNIIDKEFSPNKGVHCKKCPYYEFCY